MKIQEPINKLYDALGKSGNIDCFVSSWNEDGDCGASLENPVVSIEKTHDGSTVVVIHTANNP